MSAITTISVGAERQGADGAGRHGADGAGRHGADGAGNHGADGAGRHGADGAGQTALGATEQTALGATEQTALGATEQTALGATEQTALSGKRFAAIEEQARLVAKTTQTVDACLQRELRYFCREDVGGLPHPMCKEVGWLRKAAEDGNAWAPFYLSDCYVSGLGDLPEVEFAATERLRKVAE
ncbi:hypothetical protein FVE85_8540 [Porphyridium purpureum]|uniref:Uncharacterized protein n=1 Tax=Porphyridium purpureum TaxID=35688 RepID=A0A5J4YGT1_PORPP|nr:hypothetical protein FVE85_8540 [Porphyridium purpureum]|eukprot:POR7927..scf292_37